MINLNLLLACILWAGATLFILDLIWYWLEKKLNLLARLPSNLLEELDPGFFISRFLTQLGFIVAVPAAAYSLFYTMVPFFGVRAGVAMALFIFILGVLPFSLWFLMRLKLPVAYILFQMLGFFIRIVIIYGIIAYLYIL